MNVDGLSGGKEALIVLVAGIGLALYGGYSLTQQSAALQNAEKVTVTVESTGIEEISGGKRSSIDYKPTTSFSYTYNGESYTSNNIYPSGLTQEFNTEKSARNTISKYKEGQNYTGYVNPETPGKAFLKNESSNKPYFMILIGIGMAAVGLVSRLR